VTTITNEQESDASEESAARKIKEGKTRNSVRKPKKSSQDEAISGDITSNKKDGITEKIIKKENNSVFQTPVANISIKVTCYKSNLLNNNLSFYLTVFLWKMFFLLESLETKSPPLHFSTGRPYFRKIIRELPKEATKDERSRY
jgi:hypothetical protein